MRLQQGDPNKKTVYGDSPFAVAQRWQAAGTTWIHIVNLDGALDELATVWGILESIAGLGLKIQFGGGLRSTIDVANALSLGVARAVISTAAVENPEMVDELIAEHGAESVSVALDGKNGKVYTHGWRHETTWTPAKLGKEMFKRGLRHALYTDIQRDGEREGVNVTATSDLLRETGLEVVAFRWRRLS